MTEYQQDRVVCRHDETMSGLTGTCRLCGQQKDYGELVKGKPKVIKRGHLNGVMTVVVPPQLSQEETPVAPAETLSPPVPPRLGGRQGRNQYYEENRLSIISDYHSLGLRAMLKRWDISQATWLPHKDGSKGGMAVRFGIFSPAPKEGSNSEGEKTETAGTSSPPVPVAQQPTSIEPAQPPERRDRVSSHHYYETNRDAIMEDFRVLGANEMQKKWGIASSTWTYLRRRWLGQDSGRPKHTSSRNVETVPLVDETSQSVELEDEELVLVGTRVEQRNTGRTGIRHIYPN